MVGRSFEKAYVTLDLRTVVLTPYIRRSFYHRGENLATHSTNLSVYMLTSFLEDFQTSRHGRQIGRADQ
jgi:hypothetical protein